MHRASHELSIMVTAAKGEGLWPCGCGEDFGSNRRVGHPLLGRSWRADAFRAMREEKEAGGDMESEQGEIYRRGVDEAERVWTAVDVSTERALGRRHARFVNDFFYGTSNVDPSQDKERNGTDEIPSSAAYDEALLRDHLPTLSRIRHDPASAYVTALFACFVHAPCPSRSLGFAVGPFAPPLYDPEYLRANDDDESLGGDASEEEGEDHGTEVGPRGTTLREMVRRSGEGIRQLYFAPEEDRPWIHYDVTDGILFGRFDGRQSASEQPLRPNLTASQLQDRLLLRQTIVAATVGVPNRALSLMRDVLALPAYRTSSHTQIWIPHAHFSGSDCGNVVSRPEVGGCNPFLGGAILDATLLPPRGKRLPYYDAERALQGYSKFGIP